MADWHTLLTRCFRTRRFRSLLLLLSACSFAWACSSDRVAGNGPGGVPANAGRIDILLTDGWRFLRSDAAGAEVPGFDDVSWANIAVPHTWNALDGQDGGSDYHRGIGWYRRPLAVPSDMVGRRAYLQFDAANTVADVYLNGVLLGQHRGGFSAFRVDATAALVEGENVLAVKVDNSAVPDVSPLVADFTFFGGLYRDVHLLVTDNLHVDVSDHAASGAYLRTGNVSASSADFSARVRVANSGPAAEDAEIVVSVLDAGGSEVTRFSTQVAVPSSEVAEVTLGGNIENPHLWDGRSDPYLYTARVQTLRDGVVTDTITQPLGFRSFSIDADGGFTLNGRALDLHGVNRHQDRLDKGWAIGNAEHDEDMALIREMGATAIRLAHYQQAQYFYDLCDREGMLVWAEIPLVDAITDSQAFTDNTRQQLIELIRQSHNHPSIMLWGIGNEQRTDDDATNTLLAELGALAVSEDDSRLSSYAHCCGRDTSTLTSHAAVVGYNYYFGWYMGNYDQVGLWADTLHRAQPALRFSLSEYGAGASVSQHQDPPLQPAPTALFHPEEYQSALHEATWQQLAARPFVWGKYVWNMFDFASDTRNEGDAPGRNDKGLISYDRVTKKDAFYWYKANWSEEPLVYITSRRFNPRTTPSIDVKVYSNLETVTLTVNGASLPAQTSANHIFRWAAVPLELGDNQVQALGNAAGNTVTATDSVSWRRE